MTGRLKSQSVISMRFGINLAENVGPWETDEARMWLREKEQTKARRLINEARFDWWKKWVGLLSPALSVIISLLALMLAALALYLQLRGKIPASQQHTNSQLTPLRPPLIMLVSASAGIVV